MTVIDQAEKLRDMVKQKNMTENPVELPPDLTARIIAVTSGKGGVGKSNITLNLAIAFAKQEKRVVILDADFGLANIEVLFGIVPKYNLGHVFAGERSIDEIITEGPLGVKLVSGGSGIRELANFDDRRMSVVIEKLAYLDTISDIILIDTGAGISDTVINFIRASGETIIITTPEPTSLTDAYAVVKTVHGDDGPKPAFKVLVNRAESDAEAEEVFGKISKVSKHFLGIELEDIGYVPYDINVLKAVKKQEPVMLSFPESEAAKSIEKVVLKLLEIKTEEPDSGIKVFLKRLAGFFRK